jgi:flagellar motility protein MotE (MotC chaperone)
MSVPRLLPLVGVAVGGVLAVKLLSGATSLPQLFEGARAFAEGKPAAAAPAKAGKAADPAAKPADPNAPPLPPGLSPTQAAAATDAGVNASAETRPRLACTVSATDLAKEAGLSPSELQVLQSLGQRRGQLDQREADLQVQLQLLAVAETKVDAKLNALANMKKDLQALLDKADQQNDAELDRLVTVYSQMKPRDAAARMSLLDDAVRIPIAAKMKERNLSAILGQMAPADAKTITEKLAHRFESQALNDAKAAVNGTAPQAAATPPAQPGQAPAQQAAATPAPAPAAAQAQPAAPKKLAAAKKPRRARAKPKKLAAKAPAKPSTEAAASPAPAPAGQAAPSKAAG